LPDFEGELGKLEKHLASALKSYFGAISEPENETQLRRYWQCLEAATLIQENKYSASDPLKRARTAVRPMLDFEINEERIKRLTAKRNSLVHEGGQPNITEGDVDYLKTTADYSIRFLVMNMDDYTFDQFKNLYRFGSKSEGSLIQAKAHREKKLHDQKERIEELENEIESIDQIMDWLEIEERD
jgi:hypothetical protein